MLTFALWTAIIIGTVAALIVASGLVWACFFFVRAISGKDDVPLQQFEDGPQIVSEED